MKIDIALVPQSEVERIAAQLVSSGPLGCLFLPGTFGIVVNTPRVACVKVSGVWYQVYLHRLMYEYHYGPVPPGKEIRHLCGWGACGLYRHLAAGTHAENMRDVAFHYKYGPGVLAPLRYD